LARWIIAITIVRLFFSLYVLSLQSIRKIKALTILENSEKLCLSLMPIIFVLLGFGLTGIVFGKFLAAVIMAVVSGISYQLLAKRDKLLPTYSELIDAVFKVRVPKYFYFGFKVMVDKNIANLYSLLPIAILGMFMHSSAVAYFKIALSYITLPFIFMKPVSRILAVQLPKSKLYGIRILKRDFNWATLLTVLINTITVIPFVILASFLVKLFYGPDYLPVVKIVYALVPYVVLTAIGIGVSSIYRTLDKVSVLIKINSLVVLLGLPVIFLLVKNFHIAGMIIVTTFWSLMSVIIALIYIYQYLNKKINQETD
jgi:O-antigen/teichoic acid export membrane protein